MESALVGGASSSGPVAVVGLGVIGLSVMVELGRRGIEAVGFDAGNIGGRGYSSSGQTRIFRVAASDVTPEAGARDRVLWSEVEEATGRPFLGRQGAITIGHPEHPGMRQILSRHGYSRSVQVLDAHEGRRRWPACCIADEEVVVFDAEGGTMRALDGLEALHRYSTRLGGTCRWGNAVKSMQVRGKSVIIELGSGEEVKAARVVVTSGVGTSRVLPMPLNYEIERPVIAYFQYEEGHLEQAVDSPGTHLLPSGEVSFIPVGDPSAVDGRTAGGGMVKVNATSVRAPLSYRGYELPVDSELISRTSRAATRCIQYLKPHPSGNEVHIEAYSGRRHVIEVVLDGRGVAATGFSGTGFRRAPGIARGIADRVMSLLPCDD